MSETLEAVVFRCGHSQEVRIALDTKAERRALAAVLAEDNCSDCNRNWARAQRRRERDAR